MTPKRTKKRPMADGDQGCGMGAAGGDEAEDAKQDEQDAEADGQFCHFG